MMVLKSREDRQHALVVVIHTAHDDPNTSPTRGDIVGQHDGQSFAGRFYHTEDRQVILM
jgi:hypothetical protein